MNARAVYEQILEKGRQEGRKELLLRQLRHRFGALPRTVVARIDAAHDEQLDRWGERLVTSATLKEVFNQER